MGSLCTSGPAKTTSTTTPTGINQLNDIWNKVSSAASTPYQAYTGQLVADLNPTQQAGISNVSNAVGTASPYFDLASQYGQAGAASIDPNDVQKYMSPYTQSVINATQANFNEGNQQQQQQLKGNAAAQGALGGDRVGVAQAELARQQNLSQAPVIAGLQQQNYTQALAAAQQDRAAQAQGAYTFGSLAPAIQNTAIQGGTAQIGAGTVAQQNQQQNLSAQYQQYLNALAFPYQQASFLAQYGLPTASAMGSTTNSTSQPGTPSLLQSILGGAGVGLAAYDAFGGSGGSSGGSSTGDSGMYIPSNPQANLPGWDSSGNPVNRAAGGRVGMSRGGRARSRPARRAFADGGFVSQVHAIRQALRGGGPVMDMSRGPSGAYSMHGYADGGQVDENFVDGTLPWSNIFSSIPLAPPKVAAPQAPAAPSNSSGQASSSSGVGDIAKLAMKFLPMVLNRGGVVGYADGGDVELPFDDRFPMAGEINSGGDAMADPRGVRAALQAFGGQSDMAPPPPPIANVPLPPSRPPMAGAVADASPYAMPSMITNPGGAGGEPDMPPSALGYDGAPTPSGGPQTPPFASGAPMQPPMGRDSQAAISRGALGLSPEARQALLAASLGILASKASTAMGAVGEGGLQGVKTYNETKNAAQKNELEARKLIQNAEQFAKGLDLRERAQKETERSHGRLEEYRDESLARGKYQYLGPSSDGTKSIFLDQKTGETVERPIQIGAKPTQSKPIPSSIQKDLGEKAQAFSQLDSLATGFKPEYAGSVIPAAGDLQNWIARQTGIGNTDAAEWWQEYARYRNVVRNKLFGSALTNHEAREWEKADINPGMNADVLQNNLKMQRRIAEAGMKRRADSLVKQGYSKDAIEAEMGIPMGGAAPARTGAGDAPERPSTVPAGSAYSPSRKVWKAPDGAMFDETGAPVR